MSKLVIELQQECLNPKCSFSDLCQKAYFIARKLDQDEMVEFLKKEINGYPTSKEVPEYRNANVFFKARNPMRGWIPIQLPSKGTFEELSTWPITMSISEIQTAVDNKDLQTISMIIPLELQQFLIEAARIPNRYEIKMFFSKTQLVRILNTIKNQILDWALNLEQKGILGEDYEFSTKEKEIAKNMTIINNYGNINGSNVVGSAINSTLNANGVKEFDYEGAKKLLESIKELIKAPSVDENDRNLLNTQIEKIDQKINQKDSKSIGTLLNSLGVWAQSITCSVIGSDIYNKIDAFLKTIQ